MAGNRSGVSQGFILRLDLAGNTIWHNSYDFMPIAGSVENDTLFVAGAAGTRYCFAKIDLATGNVFSAVRILGNSNGATVNNRLLPTASGDFYLTGHGGLAYNIWCLKIDRDGQIIWSKLYNDASQTLKANGYEITQDDGLVFTSRKTFPGVQVAFKIDASGAVDWSYDLDKQVGLLLDDVAEEPNGNLLFTGAVRVDGILRVLLMRTDSNGRVEGCCFRPFPVQVSDYPVSTAPFTPIVGPLPTPGAKALNTEPVSLSFLDFCTPEPHTQQQVQLCPGETVLIGGVSYSAPAMVSETLTSSIDCDSVVDYTLELRPFNTRSETISFCPGDSVLLNGQFFSHAGTVIDTLAAATGCDTVVTYQLQFANAGQSASISLNCPASITVEADPGADSAPVPFDPAVASSDCVCPGISLAQTSGLPTGSAFPLGVTTVCFSAADSCQATASCCFEVLVNAPPQEACDVKSIGCLKYELLRITQDAKRRRSYHIRITNQCNEALSYAVIQQPDGLVAASPADGSVYTAPGGNNYLVRNPNFSPFYSIRFKTLGTGLKNGQSDMFRYTLPPQAEPSYIHIAAKLVSQNLVEAHLNTFNCPVEDDFTPSQRPLDRNIAPAATAGKFYFYPNPVAGTLFLDLSAWPDQDVQLSLFTMQGRLCTAWQLRGTAEPYELNIPAGLANGLYLLKVMPDGEAPFAERMVLQR